MKAIKSTQTTSNQNCLSNSRNNGVWLSYKYLTTTVIRFWVTHFAYHATTAAATSYYWQNHSKNNPSDDFSSAFQTFQAFIARVVFVSDGTSDFTLGEILPTIVKVVVEVVIEVVVVLRNNKGNENNR